MDERQRFGGSGDSDSAAVNELIADVEGELRLHRARLLEFLDGTREFEAITDEAARQQVQQLTAIVQKALDDIAPLSKGE